MEESIRIMDLYNADTVVSVVSAMPSFLASNQQDVCANALLHTPLDRCGFESIAMIV